MRQPLVALATLFFFGCQTVQLRAVEVAGAAPLPRVALAEPALELWVEGAGSVTPAETAEALARSRAALAASLDDRALVAEADADHLLLVTEQALARTEGRRQQQSGAVVGIVLLVAAVVVLIALAAQGRSHPSRAAPPGRPPVGRGVAAPPPGSSGYRGYGPPVPWFGWGFAMGVNFHGPVAAAPVRPPEALPTLEAGLESRGFFAGDEVELLVELRDRSTGQTVWSRSVRDEVDPRDPAALRALVDRLIGGEPWGRGAPPQPSPPPGAPPPPAPSPAPVAPPAPPRAGTEVALRQRSPASPGQARIPGGFPARIQPPGTDQSH